MSNPIPIATISITITNFVPATAGDCSFTMDFPNIDGVLWKAPNATGQLVLHVTAPVRFAIQLSSPDPEVSYEPVEVTFAQLPPGKDDPDGTKVFVERAYDATTRSFFVLDNWSLRGPGYAYEFVVMAKRQDGVIGRIDPEADNDEDGIPS